MDDTMEVDVAVSSAFPQPQGPTQGQPDLGVQSIPALYRSAALDLTNTAGTAPPPTAPVPSRDNFRDIQVKVHIRRPERDSWVYMGRGLVTQEVIGHSSRVGAAALLYLFYKPSEILRSRKLFALCPPGKS
jgi:hypothetical protein